MIFDSQEINSIRTRYIDLSDEQIPLILLLDRHEKFSDERELMEYSIQSAPAKKQREWLGCLFSRDEEQFIGAWFEMMLLDWLKPVGQVDVEPELLNNYPDFMVTVNGEKIVIKAKAMLVSEVDRQQDVWKGLIFRAIKPIKLPYMIVVTAAKLIAQPDTDQFIKNIQNWLETNPQDHYSFEDHHGNFVVCESEYLPSLNKLQMLWTADGAIFVNPDMIKPSLKKKANANQAIRRAGYRYVIALYIEDLLFDGEDVIPAWFGNEVVHIDIQNQKVIDRIRDDLGLHNSYGKAIHKSVSGTIVFKAEWGKVFKGGQLHGWFIENPYANVKVDPDIVPIEGKYVVVSQSESGIQMAWK